MTGIHLTQFKYVVKNMIYYRDKKYKTICHKKKSVNDLLSFSAIDYTNVYIMGSCMNLSLWPTVGGITTNS